MTITPHSLIRSWTVYACKKCETVFAVGLKPLEQVACPYCMTVSDIEHRGHFDLW